MIVPVGGAGIRRPARARLLASRAADPERTSIISSSGNRIPRRYRSALTRYRSRW